MERNARPLVSAVSCLLLLLIAHAGAQMDKINIPAGTPEDRDLQAISNEQDASKKLAMYADFVQKYASNPAARGWSTNRVAASQGGCKAEESHAVSPGSLCRCRSSR